MSEMGSDRRRAHNRRAGRESFAGYNSRICRMIRRQAAALAAGAIVLASAIVAADSWPGSRPQIYASANGAIHFKTRPPQLATWSGKSHGTLVTLSPGGSEAVKWSRELVNIPVRAFVTDDGKHVVTFDTWAKLGYEHALVIYDEEGAVVFDYDLGGLLSAEEIRKFVVETVGGRRWLQDATIAFDGLANAIVITLHWGKTIRVALSSGTIETVQ